MPTRLRIILALIIAALGTVPVYRYWQREYGPLDSGKADAAWRAWEGPRYSRSECLVKLGVTVAPEGQDAFERWFPTFTRYVYNHEPTAAFAMTGDGDGNIYLQFWDSCDRRFAIAEAMAAYFHRRHGDGVRFTVSREPVDTARITAGCGIQWLDCPR